VDTLDNIDRIAAVDDVLRHIATGRPFICRDFLRGSELHAATRDAMLRAFGDARVVDPAGRFEGTVAGYLAAAEVGPGSVTAILPPDASARLEAWTAGTPIGRTASDLVVWLGHRGCLQRFHCDMDCRDNFLAQVTGEKRVCLVSPAETQKLRPSLERRPLLSEVAFQFYSPLQKLELLRYANAYDALLGPGEMLYIPPLWWHFVEYLTESVSVSWRAMQAPLVERLRDAWPHLWLAEWPLWQGIVSRLASDRELADRYSGIAKAVLGSILDGDPETARRLRMLHDDLCPGRYAHPSGPAEQPFFELRALRPPPPKSGPWRAGDVPRLAPYVRLAHVGGALLVLDAARIVAEIELDAETHALLAELEAADRAPSVGELAQLPGWTLDDVCSVLDQLAAEGWVVSRTP
jgi:cupin-like protein